MRSLQNPRKGEYLPWLPLEQCLNLLVFSWAFTVDWMFPRPCSHFREMCVVYNRTVFKICKHDTARFWLVDWDNAVLSIRPEGTQDENRNSCWQFALVYPVSLCLSTWRGYQADFNGRCVVVDLYAVLAQRFTVSSGKQTAAWRRSQGCDCVARKLKWKFNLCSWILRWNFGRGDILTWNFWLRSAGCPDWKCSALLSL